MRPPRAQFDVFYGATDPAATHVYVRWWPDPNENRPELRLAGVVRGPFSRLARTLPATVPLADQGPGESLLARGVLPDPCYWMPGAPYLYQVEVEVRDGRHVVAHTEQTLGVRPLGVSGRRFKFGGRGWFPRAIHQDIVAADITTAHIVAADHAGDLAAWRELGAVMIARSPSDELCRQASEQGVLIFAELPSGGARGDAGDASRDAPQRVGRMVNPSEPPPHEAVAPQIRRLAQWPAVGLVILPSELPILEAARAAGRNLLFAQAPGQGFESAADCLMALADVGDQLAAAEAAASGKAVIGARRYERKVSLADARSACDDLQAELAGRAQVAGVALLPAPAERT